MASIEGGVMSALYQKSLMGEAHYVDDKFLLFIDKDLNDIIDEINKSGVQINLERLEDHIKEYEELEKVSSKQFEEYVAKNGGEGLNLNKRADLIKWFFEILGLPVYKAGKTGPSLDSESLEALAQKNISAEYYANAKQAHSAVTMLKNIKAAVHDGRIYPQHNLNKAASGRFSSSGKDGDKLNINGWPKQIRDILTTDPEESDKEKIIVSFDYKNMEGAVSASLAGEESLIQDMENDVDLHQKLADILGVDRKTAKIVNHGVNYGMTAFGLARKIGCTEEEAETFIEKYWQQRPKIRTFKQDVIQTAHMMDYISTISGFRRPTKDLSDNQIWNTLIQGSAADLFKEAVARVSRYLKSTGYGKIKVLMHDAIICELYKEHADEAIKEIKDIMEHIHPEFFLKVDVEQGKW